MEMLPKFVSMALTAKKDGESNDFMNECAPIYPYGLTISLGDEQLSKLGLPAECEVGDLMHMHCIAKVISVSKNDTESGTRTNVALQITDIACENEDEENRMAEDVIEPEAHKSFAFKKLYNKE